MTLSHDLTEPDVYNHHEHQILPLLVCDHRDECTYVLTRKTISVSAATEIMSDSSDSHGQHTMSRLNLFTSVYALSIGFCYARDSGTDESVDASGYHRGHWDGFSIPSSVHQD